MRPPMIMKKKKVGTFCTVCSLAPEQGTLVCPLFFRCPPERFFNRVVTSTAIDETSRSNHGGADFVPCYLPTIRGCGSRPRSVPLHLFVGYPPRLTFAMLLIGNRHCHRITECSRGTHTKPNKNFRRRKPSPRCKRPKRVFRYPFYRGHPATTRRIEKGSQRL